MSTFDGRLTEYPLISIDKFKLNGAKYFLLSHVHSDHLDGLQNERFNKKIYCSEESAKILPLITHSRTGRPLYAHLKDLLVPIPYNKKYTIDTEEYNKVEVTFLPANHCLGSSIILMECKYKETILYAQDIRAEEDFVKENYSLLLEYHIQNLYMDTTCLYAEKMNFLPKKKSAELLINKIQSFDDYHHVYLDFWQLGYEELWKAVYEKFKKKIHVSQERYELFCTADPSYTNILTTDCNSTRFHSCNWESNCAVHGKYTIVFHPKPKVNREITIFNSNSEERLLQSDLPYRAEIKLQMILPFSTHSSCFEIGQFYKYIKPKTFTACVAHGGYETIAKMRELMLSLGCNIGKVNTPDEGFLSPSKRMRFSASSTSSSARSHTAPDVETWSADGSATRNSHKQRSLLSDATNVMSLTMDQIISSNSVQNKKPREEEEEWNLVLTSQYALPESLEAVQEEEEECIVISSDEEEYNKPFFTHNLFKQLKRKLNRL